MLAKIDDHQSLEVIYEFPGGQRIPLVYIDNETYEQQPKDIEGMPIYYTLYTEHSENFEVEMQIYTYPKNIDGRFLVYVKEN